MTSKIKLAVAMSVYAIALVGCPTPMRKAEMASWTPCDASRPGARCDVNVVASSTGRYRCDIGRFDVQPEFMEFRGGRPVNIRFSLPDAYQFCAADGPALKSGSLSMSYGQLYESFGADKNDGSREAFDVAKACRSFWMWNWANTNPGSEHEYLIRFRDRDGRQCTIAPWFKNG